jgi:hypothetical protein
VAETPDNDNQGDIPPLPVQRASRGVAVTVTVMAALIVIAAATANFLPSFESFPLPGVDRLAFPRLDHFAFFNFNRGASPRSDRVAAQPPQQPPQKTVSVLIPDHKPAPAPVVIPDPFVNATLRDIQSSQQQSSVVLASLTQSSVTQQNDLKRISRQLTALAVQVDALNSAVAPATTGSIPHPHANPVVQRVNPRARVLRTARRTEKPEPPLPPPVGPVSVGGAPLAPAAPSGSVAR